MDKITFQQVLQQFYQKSLDWILTNLPSILLVLILFFVVLKLYNFLVNRLKNFIIRRNAEREELDKREESEKRINTLVGIIKQAGKLLIWVVFLMILLSKFGVNIGPIIASAGILGLAVGFGAQELVRDIISGFFILLENQVRAGDVAIINGTGGLVEKIELRTITLRDLSGVVHVFQNGKINTLSNMTKEWSAMVFDIGIAYKEDTDAVTEIIKEVAEELKADENFKDKILEPLEVLGVDQFANSSVVVKARFKTKPGQQWATGREYRRRLKKAFDTKNIEIPFPHTTLYWGENSKPFQLKMNDEKAKK